MKKMTLILSSEKANYVLHTTFILIVTDGIRWGLCELGMLTASLNML